MIQYIILYYHSYNFIFIMKTRSQTKLENEISYNVNIDFDEASKLWRQNKRYIGNGSFVYICKGKTKLGKSCKNKCSNTLEYCKIHQII